MACKICGCPEQRWLRVSTISRQFHCSRKRIRRMIKRGEIDAVMFGGQWCVDHETLDELVARQTVRFGGIDRQEQT